MSNVQREVLNLRSEDRVCCPLCDQPWEAAEKLKIINQHVYWKWLKLKLSPSHVQVLRLLLQRPGQEFTSSAIHHDLYGHRPDGGPIMKVIHVYMCKINQEFKRKKVPFKAQNSKGVGYTLIPRKIEE